MDTAWGNIRSPKISKSFKTPSLPSVDIFRILAKICFLLPLSNFGWELNILRCCIMQTNYLSLFACSLFVKTSGSVAWAARRLSISPSFLSVLFPVSISPPLIFMSCVTCSVCTYVGRMYSRAAGQVSQAEYFVKRFLAVAFVCWNALTDAINSTGWCLPNIRYYIW